MKTYSLLDSWIAVVGETVIVPVPCSAVTLSVGEPAPNAVAQAGGLWAYLVHAWGIGLLVGEAFTVAAVMLTWMVSTL